MIAIETIDSISRWLARHRGEHLDINSEDTVTGRHNRVRITLEEFFLRSTPPDPDNYVSSKELIVRGQGTISADRGSQPLPLDSFEIPLDESTAVGPKNGQLDIYTAKNTYSIRVH